MDFIKREVKANQDLVSREWNKINFQVKELEALHHKYEQEKQAFIEERSSLRNQYEVKMKELDKRKKEISEEEAWLRKDRQTLKKQQEKFLAEKERYDVADQDLDERYESFHKEKREFEYQKAKSNSKFG